MPKKLKKITWLEWKEFLQKNKCNVAPYNKPVIGLLYAMFDFEPQEYGFEVS